MRICIDGGHGPQTPGKRAFDDSMREFHFNSDVAERVSSALLNYENVHVLMVHDNTADVPLETRVKKANDWNADIYVSIHANAFDKTWNSVNGIETYINNDKPHQALVLASEVQTQLIRHTGRRNRGVKTANFYVLKYTNMTAILCECGFMTNTEELTLLKSESYRQKVSEAIVQGIVNVYNLKQKYHKAPTPTNTKSNKLYKVQVGAFSKKENAEKLMVQLENDGYKPFMFLE